MKLILHEYDLPLTHPFTISRGSITSQPTLIAELREDELSGFGTEGVRPSPSEIDRCLTAVNFMRNMMNAGEQGAAVARS